MTHALMEKPGEGKMYVPPDKVQEYLDGGWTIIQPAKSEPETEKRGNSVEEVVETIAKKSKK